MAISRAELAAMDRDELVETVAVLANELEDLKARVSEDFDTAAQDRAALRTATHDLQDRVAALENESERLRERVDSPTADVDGKVAKLVEFAHNKRTTEDVVLLTPQEIRGAYGCSERWAYQLCDDLPAKYDWLISRDDLSQYGDAERDIDAQAKALAVDFEGVQSAGVPLNRFINGTGGGQG